jgi:asparagine synthase (glutamine-hydrolysing)
MRSLVAFIGCPETPAQAIAWSDTDAAGRSIVLAHGGAAVAVATNEQGTVRAVLAGTIANARELRAGLAARHALGGRDDAEIAVHLYEERGIQSVKAMRGAFAVALWDTRRQRLLLARDQLGLLPLYYAADGERLAVSSALPALVAVPGLAGTWDAHALDAFLTLGCVPPPATFYTGIRALGPGELAVWEDGRLRRQRYWQLTFPERRLARPDAPRLLRVQLVEAVRMRQAGVLAGVLLTDDLDAAAVLALATLEGRTPLRAYAAADDPAATTSLADRAGIEHVTADAAVDPLALLDGLLAAHGGPVGGPGIAALQEAATRARCDVEVALAGTGGADVFGGSPPARMAERIRRYGRLPAFAREATQVWARVAPPRWTGELRRLVAEQPLAPLERYARATSLLTAEERAALYTPDALAILGDVSPWAAVTALFADAVSAGATDACDAVHYVELALRLPARAAAASAACAGMDLRLPLADHRLAQFVASVPAELRASRTEGEALLRAALADLLPARRPGLSRLAGTHATGRGLPLPHEVLASRRLAAQGVFRPEVVAALREEHASGARDHGRTLWAVAMATRWLDGQPLPVAAAPVREAV